MNIDKIKRTIKDKKITLKHLSYEIGVTEQGLIKMFNNHNLKVETLEKIAQALEVPVSYFFDEQDNGGHIIKNNNVIVGNNNQQHNANDMKEIEFLKKENEHLKKIIELLER